MNWRPQVCCDRCDARQIPPVLGAHDCWDENCKCHKPRGGPEPTGEAARHRPRRPPVVALSAEQRVPATGASMNLITGLEHDANCGLNEIAAELKRPMDCTCGAVFFFLRARLKELAALMEMDIELGKVTPGEIRRHLLDEVTEVTQL